MRMSGLYYCQELASTLALVSMFVMSTPRIESCLRKRQVQAASTAGPVSKPAEHDDVARRAWKIRRHVFDYQNGMNAIERCEKRECSISQFECFVLTDDQP